MSTKAVFLVLASLGLIIAGVAWMSFRARDCDCTGWLRRSYHTSVLGDRDFVDSEVRFRSRGAGLALLPNGRPFSFTAVRASDCVDVFGGDEDQGSPIQAEVEMEKRIREAVRVIERGRVQRGEFIGERAILQIQKEPRIEIVVQYKPNRYLYVISSASLAHALEYEKLIQNGYRIDPHGYVVAQGKNQD